MRPDSLCPSEVDQHRCTYGSSRKVKSVLLKLIFQHGRHHRLDQGQPSFFWLISSIPEMYFLDKITDSHRRNTFQFMNPLHRPLKRPPPLSLPLRRSERSLSPFLSGSPTPSLRTNLALFNLLLTRNLALTPYDHPGRLSCQPTRDVLHTT